MSLKLPKNTSLQDLYLEEDQTIWFLVWILKQSSPCDRYISQMILESPFQVIRNKYWIYPIQYILKNGQSHGLERVWYHNGQLGYEYHWVNGRRYGLHREWYDNGKLKYESHWENGGKHGLDRGWYYNGQLKHERNWENDTLVSSKKFE